MKEKIIVTGGAGFIGSHFVDLAIACGYEVAVIDKFTYAADVANLNPDAYLICGDIVDGLAHAAGLAKRGFEPIKAIVNFAAESHVDRSIADANQFIHTNVFGTMQMLEVAKMYGCRFVQVSTDEVYGHLGPNDPPFTEKTPLAPRSPYSASKASGDLLALAYHATHGLDVVITRCSNNFGPRQHDEKLVPTIVNRIVNNRMVPLYGAGTNVRDWIYVKDHCLGILVAMEKGKAGEVYNFGGGVEMENMAMVGHIAPLLGRVPGEVVEHVADRKGHDFRYAVDFSKANEQLGWTPVFRFDDAIQHTVEWYEAKYKSGVL